MKKNSGIYPLCFFFKQGASAEQFNWSYLSALHKKSKRIQDYIYACMHAYVYINMYKLENNVCIIFHIFEILFFIFDIYTIYIYVYTICLIELARLQNFRWTDFVEQISLVGVRKKQSNAPQELKKTW